MEYKLRDLQDFFSLYEMEYEKALGIFHGKDFIFWLREKGYEEERKLYKKCKLNQDVQISLQNFLQRQDFDVKPTLKIQVKGDRILLKNIGKGYLYGTLEYGEGIEGDVLEWGSEGEIETGVLCRGCGKIQIFSNGGCEEIFIKSATHLDFPIDYEEKELEFKSFLEEKVKIKGSFGMPKIIKDNDYVEVYQDENNDSVLRKKVSLPSMLKRKFQKKETVTNVKIVYPEKIIGIRIIIS